jgi:hypothetical protein
VSRGRCDALRDEVRLERRKLRSVLVVYPKYIFEGVSFTTSHFFGFYYLLYFFMMFLLYYNCLWCRVCSSDLEQGLQTARMLRSTNGDFLRISPWMDCGKAWTSRLMLQIPS